MKRRDFIKTIAIALSALSLPLPKLLRKRVLAEKIYYSRISKGSNNFLRIALYRGKYYVKEIALKPPDGHSFGYNFGTLIGSQFIEPDEYTIPTLPKGA